MNGSYDNMLILVVIIGFVLGYVLLSYIVKIIKSKSNHTINSEEKNNKSDNEAGGRQNNTDKGFSGEKGSEYSRNDQGGQEYKTSGADFEKQSHEILGIKYGASPSEIKSQYRNLLAKYHPDKVSHLGLEFQKIAAAKTKAIIRAYEYLKRKYNIK